MSLSHLHSSEVGPGTLVGGKYRLSKLLGAGGMAAVWLATNEATGGDVAVKMALGGLAGSAAMQRLRREAQAAAGLCHRGIVRVYDLVELAPEAGVALVMDHLRGRTLAEHLHACERLSVDDALAIVLPVLGALAHAHAVGIVHRDLKPENIVLAVEPDGVVTPKLVDFGICKQRWSASAAATEGEEEVAGTPCYMSPEQLRGDPDADERSDVFSAGVVLYELLSGANPFGKDDLQMTVTAVLESEPAPIDGLPEHLWAALQRAMQKSPDARFRTAAAFASALRAAGGVAAAASAPDAIDTSFAHSVRPTPPGERRRRAPMTLRATVGATVLATLAVILAVCATDLFPPAKAAPARFVRVTSSMAVRELVRRPRPELAPRERGTTASTKQAMAARRGHRLAGLARDPGF